jgi:four helix bundle protein
MSAGYKKLDVWNKSMDLTVETYELIKSLPKTELYAISDQMRRAAVSVPSNIAEGQQRKSKKEFINFLSIARGSLAELETQFILCVRLNYLTENQISSVLKLCDDIGLMLTALMNSLSTEK